MPTLRSQLGALTQDSDDGDIVGEFSPTTNKVPVLQSPNKAVILPSVTNTYRIINPSVGMLVYFKKKHIF